VTHTVVRLCTAAIVVVIAGCGTEAASVTAPAPEP
jgi:hypothetical protein